jgi:hypothetical protein
MHHLNDDCETGEVEDGEENHDRASSTMQKTSPTIRRTLVIRAMVNITRS